MKNYHISISFLLFSLYTSSILSMDPPKRSIERNFSNRSDRRVFSNIYTHDNLLSKADKGSAKDERLQKKVKQPPLPPTINFDKKNGFKGLLLFQAVYVRQLIAQDGTKIQNYNEVRRVQNVLREGLEKYNYTKLQATYSSDLLYFVRCIAYLDKDCIEWQKKINFKELYEAEKIITTNPHLVNYYFIDSSSSGYQKKIGTPIHYILNKASRDPEFRDGSCLVLSNLLNNGANPKLVDKAGNSPMHQVSVLGHIDILLKWGAAVNQKNKAGITPLMKIYLNNPDSPLLGYLLYAGLDTNAQDAEGNTILHLAIKRKDSMVSVSFLKYNTSFMISNNEGKTAACYAHDIPEMKRLIEPYMQRYIWNNLQAGQFTKVEECMKMYPWMSLNLVDKTLLEWIEELCTKTEVNFFKSMIKKYRQS